MSSDARPIDPLRFAEALETLPLDALHAKAAELSNSIEQLRSSNEQMVPFADEGDQDCKDAMFENLGVITRMHHRVELIKAEVEKSLLCSRVGREDQISGVPCQPIQETHDVFNCKECQWKSAHGSDRRTSKETQKEGEHSLVF